MKKIGLSLIVLAPLIWAGLTWLSSNKTEEVFGNSLAQSTSISAAIISNQETSFNKGFVKSTATSSMTLMLLGETFEIPFKHDIYHGPVMMTPNGLKFGSTYILTTLDSSILSPEQNEVINAIFKGEEPFTQGSKVGIGSQVNVEIQIAPMQINKTELVPLLSDSSTLEHSPNVVLDGIQADFTTDSNASTFNGDINIGKISMEDLATKEGRFINIQLSPSTFSANADEIYLGNLLIGTFKGNLPELRVKADSTDVIIAKNITTKNIAAEQNQSWFSDLSFKVDEVTINDPTLSEPFSEASFNLYTKIYGFDLEKIRHLAKMVHEQEVEVITSAKQSQTTEQADKLILTALGETIQAGTGINLLMEIDTKQSNSKLDFDIQYTSEQKITDVTDANIAEIFEALKGTLDVQLDKAMIKGTDLEAILASPPANELFIKSETAFNINSTLEKGELKVNEQLIPILEMFGLNTPN